MEPAFWTKLGKQASFTGLFVAHLVSVSEFGALVGWWLARRNSYLDKSLPECGL